MKKILSLLFALILLLCGCSGKDGKKGRGQKYMFPTSDAFSAEITAKQGDFTFSGLLTFSSENGFTLSYSEPSDIAGITVSLKDDTAKVTCPEMEPVIVSLPDSSALCFTEKVFDVVNDVLLEAFLIEISHLLHRINPPCLCAYVHPKMPTLILRNMSISSPLLILSLPLS